MLDLISVGSIFLKDHDAWNENEIINRAKQLARTYYETLFNRRTE